MENINSNFEEKENLIYTALDGWIVCLCFILKQYINFAYKETTVKDLFQDKALLERSRLA